MEKLSKILIVVCVLFIVVGIYWMTANTCLDQFILVKAFFYVICKYCI